MGYGGTCLPSIHDSRQAPARANTLRQLPGPAKRLGRRVDLRADWEDVKDDLMRSILEAKLGVPELRDALVATDDAELVEGNIWGDTYWGFCDGEGRNQLSLTLMRIRADIRRRA